MIGGATGGSVSFLLYPRREIEQHELEERARREMKPSPLSAWARVALLLFAAGWGANHFVPLLLVYRERMRLSPVNLAVLFGAYALGLVPGLLFGGPLSDRRGRRAIVLPAAFVALAGSLLLAIAAGFPGLLAGRLVVGAGCGAIFGAGTAWVQDLAQGAPPGAGARRAAIALSSGFGGGPLVSSVVAQWLHWPTVTPYLVHAAVMIVGIVLAWAAPGARHDGQGAHVRLALPRGFFSEIAPMAPWVFAFPSIAFAVLPALVRHQVGHLAIVYGGAVTATTLLAGVLAQPFVRRIEPRRSATLGLGVGAAGLLVGLAATSLASPAGVLFAGVFLGAAYGACLVGGLRWIEAATTPSARGRVVGVFYVLTYIGFTSPLLLAALARRAGDAAGLALATVLAAGTAAYTMFR
jgi:MFS family permease